MNKKHLALLAYVGAVGAAAAIAHADPATAPIIHLGLPALAAIAAWLGLTSPDATAKPPPPPPPQPEERL